MKSIGNKSRTTNTVLNFVSSLGGQFLTILLQFIVRTVFIQTLGRSYLGISGLFSNILSMLSLAEMGIGNAILFKMYKPIAEDDHRRISILMAFYKKVYRYIGLVVVILGVCLIPLLPFLVKGYSSLAELHINAVFIYILYLIETASSYFFFAYKSAIIKADQKAYLVTLVQYFTTTLASILQIICLYVYSNFTVFVFILIARTIGQNILTAMLANRLYPYIVDKPEGEISKQESLSIFKDCGALFLFKLNQVVIKATDNIVISAVIGLEMVGLYSNYYILYTTVNTFFNRVFDSVVHSLGNLHVESETKHEYDIYEAANFVTAILGGTAGVGIYVVADELVSTWIGPDWILATPFSLLMGIETFTLAFRKVIGRYRNSMGLFQQAKWRPLAGMLINLIVSIILANTWGICGVLVGTIVADWATYMWFDPLIIHKYGFNGKYHVRRYYYKFLKYFVITCAIGFMNSHICSQLLIGHGWISVISHSVLCAVTVPGILLILHCRTTEGKYLIKVLKRYFNRFVNTK